MYLLDPKKYTHRSKTPIPVQKRSNSQLKISDNSKKRTAHHSQVESFLESMRSFSPSEEKMLRCLRHSQPQAEIEEVFPAAESSLKKINSLQQENRELQARCIRSELSYETAIRELTQELQNLQSHKSRAEKAKKILAEVQEIRNRLDKVEAVARSVLNE